MYLVKRGSSGGGPVAGDYIDKTIAALTYYVATTGSDITGTGTLLNPFASIQKAIDTLPGQINHDCLINVAAGTYNTNLYIAKVYNTSSATRYLRIQGERTILAGPMAIGSLAVVNTVGEADGINYQNLVLTIPGSSFTVNEFAGKWFLPTSGKGYSTYDLAYMVISNTADTLTLRNVALLTTFDATTNFIIFEPAVITTRPVSTVGCQKSLVVHYNSLSFKASSGTYNVFDKDSAVWYSGCDMTRSGPSSIHGSIASEATCYGVLTDGASTAASGHVASNLAVLAHNNCVFRNFTGASNRQAAYLTNSIGSAVGCYFDNNYYDVRCLQDSTYAFTNSGNLCLNGNYGFYAQRGGTIDAIYCISKAHIYVNRVADGGIVEFSSALVSYTTDLNYFDSAGGLAIDVTTDILYRKIVVQRQDKTSDYTAVAIKSGMLYTNTGATGEVIVTLPSAVAGLCQDFSVEAAQYLRVKAAAGDIISYLGDNSAAAGYWRSNVEGAQLRVECRNTTEWRITYMLGAWTKDS